MQKIIKLWKPYSKFWRTVIVIFLAMVFIVAVLLAALTPVYDFLWSGWIYGAAVAAFAHVFAYWALKLILHNFRSKKAAFSLSFLRLTLSLILQAGFFIVLIVANNVYFGDAPLASSVSNLAHGPLNLFTYLAGVSSIMIALFIAPLATRKVV